MQIGAIIGFAIGSIGGLLVSRPVLGVIGLIRKSWLKEAVNRLLAERLRHPDLNRIEINSAHSHQ